MTTALFALHARGGEEGPEPEAEFAVRQQTLSSTAIHIRWIELELEAPRPAARTAFLGKGVK